MFNAADVVLRAVVIDIGNDSLSIDPMLANKAAKLQILEVWKGNPGSATLRYTEQSTACGVTLQVGESITVFAAQGREGELYAGWRQIAEHSNFRLDLAFLNDYRRRTERLRAAYLNGAEPEAIAFAHHLTRSNANAEALVVYRDMIDRYDQDARARLGLAIAQYGLRDEDGADDSLRSAIQADPSLQQLRPTDSSMSEALNAWIARARFVLIGQLDGSSQDMAGLRPEGDCELSSLTIEGTSFGRADLSSCSFDNARIRGVAFDGARLNSASFAGASLENVNFSGADLAAASFVGASVNLGDLLGTRDGWSAANILKASYDKAVLNCTLEDAHYFNTSFNSGMRRLWRPKLQAEQDALRSIVGAWPTARLTQSCRSLLDLDLTEQ